jgi:hypothetical protein
VAEEELLVGVVVDVDDAAPVLPVDPVVPESAEVLFEELWVFVAVDFDEEEVSVPEVRVAPAPG